MSVVFTSQTYSKYRSSGNDGNPYLYYLTVDVQSQDIATNSSTVLFTLYMRAQVGSGTLMWNIPGGSAPTSSITVDGTTYASTTNLGNSSADAWLDSGYFRRYKRKATDVAICSKTLTIVHDTDGKKFISVSFKWTAGTTVPQYYPVTFTSNGATVQLPDIARTGTFILPDAVLVSNLVDSLSLFVYSHYHYWYDLSYTIDGNTATALTKQEIDTDVRYQVTVSYAWLEEHLTTKGTDNLVFTLTTYADSAGNTVIGTTTGSVMVSIDTSVFRPSVNVGTISVYTDGLNGKLVAGVSTAKMTYTVSLNSHASGATVYFSVSKGTLVSYNSTSLFGIVYTNVLPANTSNYTFQMTANAIDSRGATNAALTGTVGSVYGYAPPSIDTPKAYRTANGSTNPDNAGAYVYVSYSASTSYTVGGDNSIQSYGCTYNGNPVSSGTWTSLALTSTGTFTFTATDNITTSTVKIKVPLGILAFDFVDPDGSAQNLGAALCGPAATQDVIKLGGSTVTEINMMASAMQVFAGGETVGYEGANSTDANNLFPANNLGVKMFSATSAAGRTNWPTTRARAVIVALRLTASYGMQLCWGNTDSIIYHRVYNNGTWGAWKSITFS